MFRDVNWSDLTSAPVLKEGSVLDWRVEFGLYLRHTPSQKRRVRDVKTLEAYERDIKLMAAWFETKYGVRAFEPTDLNEVNLQEYFLQFENSPATHKRKLASVRLLIKWAREVNLLDYDPSSWIPFVEVVKQAPRDLLPEEQKQLEAVAEALAGDGSLLGLRDSLIFYLMLEAGLRISEVIELKISDLNLDKGHIHVLGKGKKHRYPHVKSTLARRIRFWLERMPVSVEGTLITSEAGTAIGRDRAWEVFKAIAEKAGVNATPHCLRHQFVMNYMAAYMRGDPMRFPAALDAVCIETGDTKEVILKYYTGARESDMRAALEAM